MIRKYFTMSTHGTDSLSANEHDKTSPQENQPKRSKKWLSAAFNMAVGAGISATVKSCAFGLLACTSAPALATVLVPAAAAGMALSLYSMNRDYQTAKKAGEESPTFWSWKKFFFNTTTALAGGAIVGFWGDEIKNGLMGLFNSAGTGDALPLMQEPTIPPIEPVQPAETQTPLPPQPEEIEPAAGSDNDAPATEEPVEETVPEEPETTEPEAYVPTETMEKAAAYIENDPDTPQKILDRLDDAMNGDPQAQKDIADHLFNDCYPEDGQKNTAALLAKESAAAGNIQAKEFWSYVRYWGLAGIESNKTEALAAMREIDTDSARYLAAQWGGDIPMEQVEDVNCDEDSNTDTGVVADDFNDEANKSGADENPVSEEKNNIESDNQPVTPSQPAEPSSSPQERDGCTAIIDIEEGISFLCTIDENINVQEGDKMTVDNPPVSAHGLLKDENSKIIFGMPRP